METRPFSDVSYNQFLNEDKLMGCRCKSCGTLYLPPRSICIGCYSSNMEWVEMDGKGKLVAFTVVSVGPPYMAAEGFNRKNPYCVGVVEMGEGVKIDARIEGLDMKNPETIRVGTPLTLKFLHRGETEKMKTFVAFEA
ncbi:MAG: Zn-ribbon domain-containing OB-fold protein [Syntrophales bacterium]